MTDTQIKDERFLEDVNNILNNGEVPNLFAADELSAVMEEVCDMLCFLLGFAKCNLFASIPDPPSLGVGVGGGRESTGYAVWKCSLCEEMSLFIRYSKEAYILPHA